MIRLNRWDRNLEIGQRSKDDTQLDQFTEINQIIFKSILQGDMKGDDVFQMYTTRRKKQNKIDPR